MFRILLALGVLGLLAAACGPGAGEPEPTATATTVPITATPTPLSQAELERLLVKISVPCREIFPPGAFETLGEGYEPLTSADIREGVVAKYQVLCSQGELIGTAFPDSVFLTISAFESPEAARESIRSAEGEAERFVFTASTNPSLGDKSAATSVVDKEKGKNGEIIDVAVGSFTISVRALGAVVDKEKVEMGEEFDLARVTALIAAKDLSENAATMQ